MQRSPSDDRQPPSAQRSPKAYGAKGDRWERIGRRMGEEGIVHTNGVTRTFELDRGLVLDNVSLGPPHSPRTPGRHQGSGALFSLLGGPGRSEEFGRVRHFLRIRTGPERGHRLSDLADGVFGWRCTGAPGWRALPVDRASLLLLGAVLMSLVPGALCGSSSHSLSYFYLRPSEPSQGLNQFFIRGFLDDQPIIHFDSLTRKMEPLVPWMEEVEKETFLAPEWVFRADLEKLSKLDRHAGGHHTWQVNLGCELREYGSKGGFLHYGYNGWDFISFDKETLRWVTAQPQAQKVKEKWEADPRWSQGNKVYLENTCIEWLQRYLSYQREALQRIEPPVGKVTYKVVDDRLEVLICQAFGFYPKEIQATWKRDNEICQYETLHRNVAPNSDGTYYVQLSIEIDPKERNRFQCHLEHEGLQEPLVLSWKEEPDTGWWIPVGMTVAIILETGILFLICLWRRSRKNRKMTTCPDQVSPQKHPPPPMDVTEDEIQSQAMLPPKVGTELNRTYGRQRFKSGLEDRISTWSSRTVKQALFACIDAPDALDALDPLKDKEAFNAAHAAVDASTAAVDASIAAVDGALPPDASSV